MWLVEVSNVYLEKIKVNKNFMNQHIGMNINLFCSILSSFDFDLLV